MTFLYLRCLIAVASLSLAGVLEAVTLNPVADAFVRSGASADTNYGSAVNMEIRDFSSHSRITFLKFDISGVSGTVTDATLRIYANVSASTQTTGAHAVSDTSWTESGLTWNNMPTIGSQLDTTVITSSSYAWYELDVTGHVATEVGSSASYVTIALQNSNDNSSVNKVKSIEASSSDWPELVITTSSLSAPSITAQPQSITTDIGEDVQFSVSATGNPTPTYQWRKDGNNISGATSSTLNLTDVQSGVAGDYDVVVTNSQGSVTSNDATLDFNPTPVIDEDFASAGDFTVVLGGTWSTTGGRYVLSSPADSNEIGILGNISVHDTTLSGDYTASTTVQIDGTTSSWDDIAFVFGYQDVNNYYYVSLNESNDDYTKGLFKVVSGTPTQLADISTSISSNTDYDIEVTRSGSSIVVELDSTQVASVTDSTFSGGKVGYGSKNDAGEFDDLLVYGTAGSGGTVVAPQMSPIGGTYTSTQNVTITSATTGATIRYTTDGGTPTSTSGTVYSGPVAISSTTTLKAIAYMAGMTDSSVTTEIYTISAPSGVTIDSGDGFYNDAIGSSLNGTFTAEFDVTPSLDPMDAVVGISPGMASGYSDIAVIVRFNSSGNIDARDGGSYSADNTIAYDEDVTYHFRLVVDVTGHTYSAYVTPNGGSEQTIGSNFDFRTEQASATSLNYWTVMVHSTYGGEVVVDDFSISGATESVAAPSFSPGGGTYGSSQSVTITSATSGASIRYTTDGSTPTSSSGTVYSSAVSIASNTTLKAIAYKSGLNDSSVTSATYIINTGGPTKPNSSNTGYTGTLTSSGSITVNTAGAVIENLNISGGVHVKANNVTIRNCKIDGGIYGVRCNYGYTGLVIEDCEIVNSSSSGVFGSNFTARRLEIHEMYSDAIKPITNCLVESCYVHHIGRAVGSHADAVQSRDGGSNMTFRWNNFDLIPTGVQPPYSSNSAFIMQSVNGALTNTLVEENWMNGGSYTYHGDGNSGITVRYNIFGRDALYGVLYPNSAPVWYGNVYEDNGDPAP